jgi:hypothetical protein
LRHFGGAWRFDARQQRYVSNRKTVLIVRAVY